MARIIIPVLFALLIANPFMANAQVFAEKDGIVAVEAEHYCKQSLDSIRKWYVTTENISPGLADPDEVHCADASGNSYMEILPDTRTNHNDKLEKGTNFTDNPGQIAVLEYKVHFTQKGKYFVWVRAYSTGSEDNGIHVGVDGNWPASGAKMQWCEGKNQWTWASKQRTNENHCGEEGLIYIEIQEPGIHKVMFSMREDGFEFDKFILSEEYIKPIGKGPDEIIYTD